MKNCGRGDNRTHNSYRWNHADKRERYWEVCRQENDFAQAAQSEINNIIIIPRVSIASYVYIFYLSARIVLANRENVMQSK